MTVFPDATKERLHGHNFQVTVGIDLADIAFEKFLDFGLVKAAVFGQCQEWDEHLLLPERCPFLTVARSDSLETVFTLCGKRYLVPTEDVILLPVDNVVVESLAVEFTRGLLKRLGDKLAPGVVMGIEVSVSESQGQGGSYYWTWGSLGV